MDFNLYREGLVRKLNREINLILADWEKEVRRVSPKLLHLTDVFIKACQGGKRIRGVLIKLGFEITGSKLTDEILKVGAAYEILHTALLIHDDIIDQSLLRRSQPTLYKTLGGDHYSISQSIGLGDAGFFLSFRIIADAKFPGEYKLKALNYLAQTVMQTGFGEMLDVELPRLDKKSEADVIAIHKLKTAQYTISGPLILGAILAGAKLDLLGKLDKFGENLGIAFQIQDDILGVFGDEKILGKPVTSDIEEGKNTLLITYALKHSNPNQKKILDKYYGKGKINKEVLNKIRKIFKDSGALDYSQQIAIKYSEEAKKIIPQITEDENFLRILSEMADFLIERKF